MPAAFQGSWEKLHLVSTELIITSATDYDAQDDNQTARRIQLGGFTIYDGVEAFCALPSTAKLSISWVTTGWYLIVRQFLTHPHQSAKLNGQRKEHSSYLHPEGEWIVKNQNQKISQNDTSFHNFEFHNHIRTSPTRDKEANTMKLSLTIATLPTLLLSTSVQAKKKTSAHAGSREGED
jgi:hypothetical protein